MQQFHAMVNTILDVFNLDCFAKPRCKINQQLLSLSFCYCFFLFSKMLLLLMYVSFLPTNQSVSYIIFLFFFAPFLSINSKISLLTLQKELDNFMEHRSMKVYYFSHSILPVAWEQCIVEYRLQGNSGKRLCFHLLLRSSSEVSSCSL